MDKEKELQEERREHFRLVSTSKSLNGGTYLPATFAGNFAVPLTNKELVKLYGKESIAQRRS